jgi:hypothetical protein
MLMMVNASKSCRIKRSLNFRKNFRLLIIDIIKIEIEIDDKNYRIHLEGYL